MTNWQKVFKDSHEHRVSIVRDVLLDGDIDAVIVSKKDSPYGFGFLEVQVPSDQVILAIKIIEQDINFE